MQKSKCYSYIRFSNAKQKLGDSTRRQIEAAEKYAEDKGLELDTTLNLQDEGLSGYSGQHIKEGNLGKFLALIESGKIASGSKLIVESIDRLGRQEPLTATDVIKLILRAGITLVVLDWYRVRELSDESIRNNPGEFSGLVAEIERAYFESKKKAERLSQAWKEKRKRAREGGNKLTGVCPQWLELSEDKTEFIILEDVREAVIQIFKLKASGLGNSKIVNTLNKDPKFWKPPISKRNKKGGWVSSTIQRYLADRRVLGEFQPHKKIEGERSEMGEPIKNYYPSIIEEDLFYAVQTRMKHWRKQHGHPGGRADKAKNLFVHIAKCGKCGNKLHFIDKGDGSKGGQYLHCSLSRESNRSNKGLKCNAKAINYRNFFNTFFNHTKEVTASDILPSSDIYFEQLQKLALVIEANGERIEELVRKENNIVDSISDTDSPEARNKLKTRLNEIISESKELKEQNKTLFQKRVDIERHANEIQTQLDTLKEIRQLLDNAKNEDEAKEIRLKIRGVIKQLIDEIKVFPSNNSKMKFDRVIVTFKDATPFARLLTFTEEGWKVLNRNNAPKKTA